MVEIVAIHMNGGSGHEHIAELKWVNPDTGAAGKSSRSAMVDFVNKHPKGAYVEGQPRAYLHVRNATPPYVQTYADSLWGNNLLSLERY